MVRQACAKLNVKPIATCSIANLSLRKKGEPDMSKINKLAIQRTVLEASKSVSFYVVTQTNLDTKEIQVFGLFVSDSAARDWADDLAVASPDFQYDVSVLEPFIDND